MEEKDTRAVGTEFLTSFGVFGIVGNVNGFMTALDPTELVTNV